MYIPCGLVSLGRISHYKELFEPSGKLLIDMTTPFYIYFLFFYICTHPPVMKDYTTIYRQQRLLSHLEPQPSTQNIIKGGLNKSVFHPFLFI